MRKSAGEFAHHERRRYAPENRRENQNQNSAAVARAMNDVLGAVRAAGHHEEGRRHERPQSRGSRCVSRKATRLGGSLVSIEVNAPLLPAAVSPLRGSPPIKRSIRISRRNEKTNPGAR